MVTNRLQRNVHGVGFVVYLVETTDMQQLWAFMLKNWWEFVCIVVAVIDQLRVS